VNIIYGNPQMEQKEKMDKGSSLYSSVKDTDLWKKWKSTTPPLQSSDAVVKAIEELILIGAAQTEEDKEFVKDITIWNIRLDNLEKGFKYDLDVIIEEAKESLGREISVRAEVYGDSPVGDLMDYTIKIK